MKKLILGFLIGFYGLALFIDTPEILILKSKIFFGGVVLVLFLTIFEEKNKK